MAHTPTLDAQPTALLRNLIHALEDKKAIDLKVLHVGGVSNITDYLILATGNSEPHLRALRIEAEKVLDAAKAPIAGMEQGGFNSGWTVVDAYQIMVHLFTLEQRSNYALEKLWKDAAELDLKNLTAKPEAAAEVKPTKAKAKSPKGKTSAGKTPSKAKKPADEAKPSTTKKALTKPAAKAAAKATPLTTPLARKTVKNPLKTPKKVTEAIPDEEVKKQVKPKAKAVKQGEAVAKPTPTAAATKTKTARAKK